MRTLPRSALVTSATALALLLAGCGGTSPGASTATTTPTSTAATTTTTTTLPTTTVAPTTTTTALPSSLQSSDDDAAQAFVNAWSQGQRAVALTVGTRPAVAEAFRAGYPAGGLQFRNCSVEFAPRFCSYGALSIGALVEVYVREAAGGWYVTRVVVET